MEVLGLRAICAVRLRLPPASANKDTPLNDKNRGNISFPNTKLGAGERFLLLDFRPAASTQKGCVFS